jgi:hypothetical protein
MNDQTNQFRLVEEKDTFIVLEVPSREINLMDQEQLEELKKPFPQFFDCTNYVVNETAVQFVYNKEKEYKPIENYRNKDRASMKKAAVQLLDIEKLIGTQYTTVIHPSNIYMKPDGTIKLAHRGIRNVFPNQTMSAAKLVTELRKVFIYLFSDIPYEAIEANTYPLQLEAPLLLQIKQSKTLSELKKALEQHASNAEVKKEAAPSKDKNKVQTESKKKSAGSLQKVSPLVAALAGLIVGMVIIYFAQVVPLNNTSAEEANVAEDEIAVLEEEKSQLEEQLNEETSRKDAYRVVFQGEIDEAVLQLESLGDLDNVETQLLFDLYLEQNNAESLGKALELGPDYEATAIRALIDLDTEAALERVTTWETDLNEVIIEQAYVRSEYENVIELAEGLQDNRRAQLLAAYSYLETDQPAEALSIGQEIENTRIQISSWQKELELLADDDDLDEEELEERQTEIEEEIEDLQGN